MSLWGRLVQRRGKQVVALGLVGSLYWSARLPSVPPDEQARLAQRFAFVAHQLPAANSTRHKSVRAVHPSLAHIAAWISSVGASIAVNDLDGDGLSNDLCYVDPRSDSVIIAPAPGQPSRIDPFTLQPAPLPYDDARMAPMGCVTGDLNEDGLIDVLVYYWGRTPVAFLRHTGSPADSSLSYTPREVKQPVERWYTNAATLADVDGDGHLDLVVGNYFQDGARILDASAGGTEAMQASMSRALNSGRHHLLLFSHATGGDRPSVHFVEADLDDQLAFGWTLALAAADIDGDLLPELYFANDFGSDQLLHNRSKPGSPRFVPLLGRKTLTTPNSKVLGRDSFKGMGVDFGDLNDDGVLDIYVSNIAAEYALEESHLVYVSTGDLTPIAEGIAPYRDRSEPLGLSRSGWAWDAKLADFDNDGVLEAVQATGFVKGDVNRWPELHELAMGNDDLLARPIAWPRFRPGDDLSGSEHNPFFARAASGRYVDVAPHVGLGEPQVTRGVAIADVDGDGRLDLAVANQWAASRVYMNRSPSPGAFLGLHLLLPAAGQVFGATSSHPGHPRANDFGRPAIGAAVTVRLPHGGRSIAQVDGGNGHSGRRAPQLHFGLGAVPPESHIRVDVRWRDHVGAARSTSLTLMPGWHTVLLGSD